MVVAWWFLPSIHSGGVWPIRPMGMGMAIGGLGRIKKAPQTILSSCADLVYFRGVS